MSRSLLNLVVLGGLLSFCSCTKVLYTHQQVMESYHTKEAVIRQFGEPDEKMIQTNREEWLYNCDSTSVFGSSKTKVIIGGTYAGMTNAGTVNVIQFNEYAQFVTFYFGGPDGKVIKWDSRGVDFTVRKFAVGKTILLVAGSATVVTAVIAVIWFKSLDTTPIIIDSGEYVDYGW